MISSSLQTIQWIQVLNANRLLPGTSLLAKIPDHILTGTCKGCVYTQILYVTGSAKTGHNQLHICRIPVY